MAINDNRDRLAAELSRATLPASTPLLRGRRRVIARPVQADVFRPVPVRVQALVGFQGTRGQVSLSVAGGPAYTGPSARRPKRAQPQARLAAARKREPIAAMQAPAGHPAIGRTVISPIVGYGGSEL